MITKSITYTNAMGEEVTEEFYFHLAKHELFDLNVMGNKGIEEIGNELMKARDGETAWKLTKDLVLMTYCERSPDGKGYDKIDFVTGAPLSRRFQGTEAFDNLLVELVSDAAKAAEFFSALVPEKWRAELNEAVAVADKPSNHAGGGAVDVPAAPVAPEKSEPTLADFSRVQLVEMSDEQFFKLAGTDSSKWDRDTLQIAFQRKNKQQN